MPTLGARIRARRLARGLSQRQLAGTQLTRAFISMLESGKANASEATLRLLAQRLGTTLAYLMGEEGESAETNECEARSMQEAAEALLCQGRPELALPVLAMARRHELSPPLEAAVQNLTARCLHRLGRLVEALEAYQAAAVRLRQVGALTELAWTYLYWGHAALAAQEFLTAKSAYEQAISLSATRKSLVEVYAGALSFLGSTQIWLGDLQEAVKQLRLAYQTHREQGNREAAVELAAQLGGCYFELGDLHEATVWGQVCLTSGEADSLHAWRAKHLLTNVAAARGEDCGQLRQAYQECLAAFAARSSPVLQAEVLEDLAILERRAGNLELAEAQIKEALSRLDEEEHEVLRGRLYRELGLIAGAGGDRDRAYHFLSMSHLLLRRLKAAHEAERSRLELQELGGV